jgi:hypothetical protein
MEKFVYIKLCLKIFHSLVPELRKLPKDQNSCHKR